jgi:FlgD Ig-like domain
MHAQWLISQLEQTARLVLLTLVTGSLAVIVLVTPAASLTPIDDFEVGSFFMQTDALQSIIINSYESHAIWSQRDVVLVTGGVDAAAWLNAGTALDDKLHYYSPGGGIGHLRLIYNWGFPKDLTYGGNVDSIFIDLHEVIVGGWVQVVISDADTSGDVVRFPVVPGVVSFPISSFEDVDATEAVTLQVFFGPGGNEGDFEIADIRFWRGSSSAVSFFGDWVAVETPPVPTPPLSFRSIVAPRAELYRADVTIADARTPAGAVPSVKAQWEQVPFFGGGMAGMNFLWGATGDLFVDTFLELSVDLSPANGLTPELVYPPDPVIGAESFLVPVGILYRDDSGSIGGDSETRIVFTIGGGQPLAFEGAAVISTPSKQAGAEGFAVSFVLAATGNVDESAPLFDITWASDWAAVTTTDVAGAEGAAPAGSERVTLAAWPSVTRAGTEIRASLPFAEHGALAIYDTSGRLVRSLAAPRGGRSVRWDGRDESGASAASGLYFARLCDQPSGAARISLVR